MHESKPVAIITGADSGIGRASAVALAEAGFDLGITYHSDRSGAEETAAEVCRIGARVAVRRTDLEALPGAAGVIDDLADALGGIDALVNNAGVGIDAPFTEQCHSELRRVLAVDVEAPFLLSQRASRRMIADGVAGSIVNITSIHEHVPLEGAAAYCAAKGALGQLTKVMALELAPHRIRVNSVAPGEIATPMTGNHDVDPESIDRPGIPWGRPGHACEIGAVVAFLAGPESSYITGASLVADGGLTLTAAIQR